MTRQTSSSLGITRPSLAFLVWVGVAVAIVMAMPGRALAAVIVVNSPSDDDGAVGCTLRDAITAANTNTATGACIAGDGADTIKFDLSASDLTITLNSELPSITDAQMLTIYGLTINGGHQVAISGNDLFRVLDVNGGSLTLENLTVKNGSALNGEGGGIRNRNGTIFVINSTLVGNHTRSDSNTGFGGGGIVNGGAHASLLVTNSTLVGNSATGLGGGILNNEGTVTLTNSTLVDNTAHVGGGIENHAGPFEVINSTLSGNSAVVGVFDGLVGQGGGIYNRGGLTITNSTLAGNSAGEGGIGSGIVNLKGTGDVTELTITNSLVANGPFGLNCVLKDTSGEGVSAFTAEGINLDTDGSCLGFIQVDPPADLNLGPLADNGGPTPTHALLPGSVAINAGNQSLCAVDGITTDQRGFLRVGNCDIGAYEFGTIEDLIDDAASLLGSGTRSVAGLLAKLNAALASVASGNTGAACNKLGAFINQVNGNSSLTLAERQALLDAAVAIRAALGC